MESLTLMKKNKLLTFCFFLVVSVLIIDFSIRVVLAEYISPMIAKSNLAIIENTRRKISRHLSKENPVLNDHQIKFRKIYYNPWLGFQKSLQIDYYTAPTIMSMETITWLPLKRNEIEIKEGEEGCPSIFLGIRT